MQEKIVIYQVLPRLYGNKNRRLVKNGSKRQNGCGKFSSFTQKRLEDIKNLGATHIWFTGILEHATQTDYSDYGIKQDDHSLVKGLAGSPYAIKDYYDVDPDLAENVDKRMKEFEALVTRTHRSGLKVMIDFVPNHVARQYNSDSSPEGVEDFGAKDDTTKSFSPQNNFYYIDNSHFQSPQRGAECNEYIETPAKATGNNCFSPTPGKFDWYDTVKLNYGVDYLNGGAKHFNPIPDTWKKMYDILMYWGSKGIDAFRCDMSEMIPVEFWHWAIAKVKEIYPNVLFVAEIYNPSLYKSYIQFGGFDYLYDKVGLYDKLRAVVTGHCPANEITYCWQNLGEVAKNMLNFMENHDEQRIASDFFAGNAQKGKPAMLVSALMNINPIMIYSGQEYGERGMDDEGYSGVDGRTSIYDYWSSKKIRDALFYPQNMTEDDKELKGFYTVLLNKICKNKAVSSGDFFDLTYCNMDDYSRYPFDKIYSFIRKKGKELVLVVANFDTNSHNAYVKIPAHAFDYMKIEEGIYKCKDLLHDDVKATIEHISLDCNIRVEVSALSGLVLRFVKQKC